MGGEQTTGGHRCLSALSRSIKDLQPKNALEPGWIWLLAKKCDPLTKPYEGLCVSPTRGLDGAEFAGDGRFRYCRGRWCTRAGKVA
jgi:hypothetical protein